jgi:membrane protease YdiL (CAAX protease family)
VTATVLLAILGMGVAGVLLWWALASGMTPLSAGSTTGWGVLYAFIGFIGTSLLDIFPLVVADTTDPASLTTVVTLHACASLFVAGLVLAMASGHGGVARLGVRRAGGPPAPLVALAAWLATLPAVLALGWINAWILTALGHPPGTQDWIARFLASPEAQVSSLTWLAMTVVLPACEELFFRGGLYGGLRRVMPTPAAVLLAALAFGLVHDPAYALQAAGLGAALCLLYERTGSLAAPVCFHVLHNGLMLAIVSNHPEFAT